METLTAEQISKVTRCSLTNVKANWPHIVMGLEWAGINSRAVQIGMAATIAVESATFKPVKEKRETNPDTSTYRAQANYYHTGFCGRGYIQLTWKNNYLNAGKALGIDLVVYPDLALEPDVAAKIAAWFFKAKGIDAACERSDWVTVRKLLNGPNYYGFRNPAALQRFVDLCKKLEAGYGLA